MNIIRKLLKSKRVFWAVLGNGSISIASFILSISIAGSSTIEDFGEFSFAMVTYLFFTGFISAALTNISLVTPGDIDVYNRNLKRTSLSALVFGQIITLIGVFVSNPYLVILGLAFHGLMLSNYQRLFHTAAGKAKSTFWITLAWSFPTVLVGLISYVHPLSTIVIFSIWSFGGALVGYLQAVFNSSSIFPTWARAIDDRQMVYFSADFLVGQGGMILTTGLLGFLENVKILGAIRGASTLLGPVNMLSTTARSLILPFLARENNNLREQFRSAVIATLIQTVVVLPILVLMQFIPNQVGFWLLGETWILAGTIMLPVAMDAIFTLLTGIAISGHRALLAGQRTLTLRLLTGLSRPLFVLGSAVYWGIFGAAWSAALVAMVTSILWWGSYWQLTRK